MRKPLNNWETLAYDRDMLHATKRSESSNVHDSTSLTVRSFKTHAKAIQRRNRINSLVFEIIVFVSTLLLLTKAPAQHRQDVLGPMTVVQFLSAVLYLATFVPLHDLASSFSIALSHSNLLQAIWNRKCSRPTDYNFAVRGCFKSILVETWSTLTVSYRSLRSSKI